MKPIAQCHDCRQVVEWGVATPGVYKCLNCHCQITQATLDRLEAAHQKRQEDFMKAEEKYQSEVRGHATPAKNR